MWSSQSGTSEDIASNLGQELRTRFQLPALVTEASNYDADSFSKIPRTTLVLFFMSTYGEGNPADNGIYFMDWVEGGKANAFHSVPYAAVGFGNSNYKRYNNVVDSLEARLVAVEARQLIPTLRLDASQINSYEAYLEWKVGLLDSMKGMLDLKEIESEFVLGHSVTRVSSSEVEKKMGDKFTSGAILQKTNVSSHKAFNLPIKQAQRILGSEMQSCLHFEVDLSQDSMLKYHTGDYILIWAPNSADDVSRLLKLCGLAETRSELLEVTSNGASEPSNQGSTMITTAEDLLTSVIDISFRVSRDLVGKLARYAPSPEAHDHILRLSSDKDAFSGLNHISIVHLLEHIDANHQWPIPIAFMLEFLPRLRPRCYSISSSSVQQPRQATITVAIKHKTLGLAAKHLLSVQEEWETGRTSQKAPIKPNPDQGNNLNLALQATIKPSNFRLPSSKTIPIILIATGSGLAPFRAFIHERARIKLMQGTTSGKILLFMGCRQPDDFMYQDDLCAIQRDTFDGEETQLQIIAAYSRPSGLQEGQHVQDKIREYSKEVTRMLLRGNASVYVCGHAAMSRAVGEVFEEVVIEEEAWGKEEWRGFKENRTKQRKWQEDVW